MIIDIDEIVRIRDDLKRYGYEEIYIVHDIFEHLILRELYSTELFSKSVAFKGGTALSKCYLNYHRFSVDLDFTFIHDEDARELSKSKRNELNRHVRKNQIVPVFREVEERMKPLGIKLEYPLKDHGFIMGNDVFASAFIIENEVYRGEIRIEFNLGEELHYEPERVEANTLMGMSVDEYSPVEVLAYRAEEILAEKYKAMLTRVLWRDYYDAYFLWSIFGKAPTDLEDIIVEKGTGNLRREMLRKRFERVRSSLSDMENAIQSIENGMIRDSGMILRNPEEDKFMSFVRETIEQIIPIENKVEEKYIEERCSELVSKYTIPTEDGYRINEKKMNDEDRQFYEEHKEEFTRIADAECRVESEGEEDLLEL